MEIEFHQAETNLNHDAGQSQGAPPYRQTKIWRNTDMLIIDCYLSPH